MYKRLIARLFGYHQAVLKIALTPLVFDPIGIVTNLIRALQAERGGIIFLALQRPAHLVWHHRN